MKARSLLKSPSFVISTAILVTVAVVWTVTALRATQPLTLDQRAYLVGEQLQCPVCNGESVADSSSQVAADMRSVIRRKLTQGESQQAILQYFHQRYGDVILESPPAYGFDLIIWLGPIVALIAGLVVMRSFVVARRSSSREAERDQAEPDQVDDTDLDYYRTMLRREMEVEEGLPGLEGA